MHQGQIGNSGQQPVGEVDGYKHTATKPEKATENWSGSGLWRFLLMLGDNFS